MRSARTPFIALAIAETFSISGTRLSTIAIPWLVLVTTGDAVLTGLVAMAELVPYVVAKALGGPMIDRLGPKRIAIFCDVASVFVVAVVPALHLLGLLSIPLLLPIVFVMGILRGPSDAAKQAMIPEVAGLAAVPLERVTGIVGAIERLASTAGAAGAGALIAVIGPAPALVVNALTFAVAAIVVLIGIPAREAPPSASVRKQTGLAAYGRELREGWNFFRHDAVLVSIAIMVAMTNLLDQAFFAVLVPVWTLEAGHGPELLGLMFAVLSGASIVGSAIAATIAERMPRLLVYTVAFFITGVPRFVVFAIDSPLGLIFAVLAIAGFASGFLNPILSAVIFERIPKSLVGRVSALNTALCWSLMPFGGLLAGGLIGAGGLTFALFATGLAYLVATLFPLARKSFRGFARRPSAQPVPPGSPAR